MWKHITYSPEWFQEILKINVEQFGPDNDISHEDFLYHQYFENPAGNAMVDLAIDEQTQELAGQYAVWPMRVQLFGKNHLAANSLNTLTRKNFRGQGIFSGLAEKTYATETAGGHVFCYGVPNPNSYPGFMKKLSFRELGRLPLLLRPLKPSAMVAEFLHSKPLSIAAKLADPFFKLPPPRADELIKVLPITHENMELVDLFWEEIKNSYPVMNIRDSGYVRFRYLDMPRRTYYPYIAVQNGEPKAFAVGRITEVAGMQCAMLVDFLMDDHGEDAADVLLYTLLQQMRNQGASLAGSLMLAHTKEYKFMQKYGFFRCPKKLEPQPFPLILRLFDQTLETKGIYDLKNWFFTMGDYDAI